MTEAEIIRTAIYAIEAILSLAEHMGVRDGVLAALDATLAAARARTDADLKAKHAHDPK